MLSFIVNAGVGAATVWYSVYGTGWTRRIARVLLILSAVDAVFDIPEATIAGNWAWAGVECLWILALLALLVPEQTPVAVERPMDRRW